MFLETKKLTRNFGGLAAVFQLEMSVREGEIVGLIGPNGAGKTTVFNLITGFLRPSAGRILLDGKDIYQNRCDVSHLRKRVGMVFQNVNPFPKTIFENVAYGLRIHGWRNRAKLEERVIQSIKSAALWEEVKDTLHKSAFDLSGGQQQRLCIARAIANEPEVILFDEPCSALDPISTARIEQLIEELKKKYTIIIVTHNIQQAARVSDFTAFMLLGDLVEFGKTKHIFTTPKDERTENYLTGKFG